MTPAATACSLVLGRGLYHVGLEERRVASAMHRVIEKSVQQHCEVAEAIISGDAESAVSAYRQHLEHVRDTIVQLLAEKAELGAPRPPGIGLLLDKMRSVLNRLSPHLA
jgi:DNA-binding GntR family transcriptional regulator